MRKHLLLAIFLLTASLLTFARMVSVRTRPADVIVRATCTNTPEAGAFVFLNPVRDVWKEVKWEYEYLDDDFAPRPTEEELMAYMKELKALQEKMEAVTNAYACHALFIELKRHQREYRIPFKVEEVFKGYVETNELVICYSSNEFSETNTPFFKVGQEYFLFLKDRYAEPHRKGKYFHPLNSVWNPDFESACTPVSTNYVIYDKWETLAEPKLVAFHSEVKMVEHEGTRSLNHTQYVERIKNMIQKELLEKFQREKRTEE